MQNTSTINKDNASKRYRYVGGLKNQDGAVTWTTGVSADTPTEAKQALAAYFSVKLARWVGTEEIGLLNRKDN